MLLVSFTFLVRRVCPRDSFRIWSARRCPGRRDRVRRNRRPAAGRRRATYPWMHPQVNVLIDRTQANEPASYEDATNTANHTQKVRNGKRKMVTETETEMELKVRDRDRELVRKKLKDLCSRVCNIRMYFLNGVGLLGGAHWLWLCLWLWWWWWCWKCNNKKILKNKNETKNWTKLDVCY